MKIYGVAETSPVGELINKLESLCQQKGLMLSRWQANGGSHTTSITYAAHTGERAYQFRYQPKDSVKSYEHLGSMEGTTDRSDAYRKLSRMVAEIEAL